MAAALPPGDTSQATRPFSNPTCCATASQLPRLSPETRNTLRLRALKAACPHLVGIRYVVDFDGPFGGDNATHLFVSRHGDGGTPFGGGTGVDFLRDATHAAAFERGFAHLAPLHLTFDLQCAPSQLQAAAALISRHPKVSRDGTEGLAQGRESEGRLASAPA